MTVYIVTAGEYSDYGIEAVFTNKDAALKFCATKNTTDWYTYNVEEWDSDVKTVQCEKEVNMIWHEVLSYHDNGRYTDIRNPHSMASFDVRNEIINRGNRVDIYVTVKPDVDVEKVKRIMYDRFIHWRYDNEC